MRIHVSGEVEGTPFQVVSYADNSWSGYRWRVQAPYLDSGHWEQSGGAFYDDEPDHPEGGIAWAEAAVRKLLTKKPYESEEAPERFKG